MAKRFYGIEMQGKFTNQIVSGVPAGGDVTNKGRLLYDDVTEDTYIADNSGDWKPTAGVEQGSVMWFYQDTAPTGWTIVAALAQDTVIGVKSSGADTYDTGGTNNLGTWTQPNHTHGDGSYAGPSHNHLWYNYSTGVIVTLASTIVIGVASVPSVRGVTTGSSLVYTWKILSAPLIAPPSVTEPSLSNEFKFCPKT